MAGTRSLADYYFRMMTAQNSMRDVGATTVREDEGALDAWVRQDLLGRYGGLLSEPIPRELIALCPIPALRLAD